jgi:hypothetical protein
MTVKLAHPDFKRVVSVIQNLPQFSSFEGRRDLINAALRGLPEANTILARLDLEGSPMLVAVEVISFLSKFGKVSTGKESLSVFLTQAQTLIDSTDKDFIAYLFQKYLL